MQSSVTSTDSHRSAAATPDPLRDLLQVESGELDQLQQILWPTGTNKAPSPPLAPPQQPQPTRPAAAACKNNERQARYRTRRKAETQALQVQLEVLRTRLEVTQALMRRHLHTTTTAQRQLAEAQVANLHLQERLIDLERQAAADAAVYYAQQQDLSQTRRSRDAHRLSLACLVEKVAEEEALRACAGPEPGPLLGPPHVAAAAQDKS